MATELAVERLGRLLGLCWERGWQALLVYGDAWRCNYFRYISNFSILEEHAFARRMAEGEMILLLESPLVATWRTASRSCAVNQRDLEGGRQCVNFSYFRLG